MYLGPIFKNREYFLAMVKEGEVTTEEQSVKYNNVGFEDGRCQGMCVPYRSQKRQENGLFPGRQEHSPADTLILTCYKIYIFHNNHKRFQAIAPI